MIFRKLIKNLSLGMGWFGHGQNSQRDTLSKGCNIQEFSVGDRSVGDGLTLHQKKKVAERKPTILFGENDRFDG